MTPDISLHRKLNEAARRIRLLLVSQWVARTLCWTAAACVVWLLASKLSWLPAPTPELVGGILGAAAVAGGAIGLTRRLTRRDVALLTDERTDLKERLSSAVEFEKDADTNSFARMQVQDAGQHAAALDLRRAYPLRLSREMIAAAALAVILFLSFLLPTMPVFWSKQKRAELAEVKKEGIALEKLVRVTDKKADEQKLAETKKAAKEAQKLAEAMKRGKMNKAAAMIAMNKLTKQMEEQQRRMASANTPPQKPTDKAGEEIKKALEQKQIAATEAVKAKQEAAKNGLAKDGKKPGEQADGKKQGDKANKAAQQQAKAGESKPQSQAMQQAQQALQKFAQALMDQNSAQQNQALQQLADQMQSGQMSPREMQTLSQQLQQMAQALKGTDLDKVSKQMQQMAQMMRQLKLDPETLKKLASMMRQAGGT